MAIRDSIDPVKLLDTILDDCCGNRNKWWELVEFVHDYLPPHASPDTKPIKLAIRCGGQYLRDLGRGCFIWDIPYGEASDFYTPEQALLALMTAPVPPSLLNLRPEGWPDYFQ